MGQVLDMPESMVYDSKHNRYLISNKGDNIGRRGILQLSADGETLDYFAELAMDERPNAVEIIGDTLFVATEKPSVIGFHLDDARLVFDHTHGPESGKFNGLSADNLGNLYVSDSRNNIVYRLDPETAEFSELVSGGININGLRFDAGSNRILLCGWGNPASIYALDPDLKTLTTLYQGTRDEVYNIDGLAIDSCGYYYISLWSAGEIRVFNNGFGEDPVLLVSGLSGPADIDINRQANLLLVPELTGHKITFYGLDAVCIPDTSSLVQQAAGDASLFLYPSPAGNMISWKGEARVRYMEITGLNSHYLEHFAPALNQTSLPVVSLRPGIYLVRFFLEDGNMVCRKFVKL